MWSRDEKELLLCFFFRQDDSTEARILRIQTNELVDSKYGFDRYKDPGDRLGWLINMHPVRYRSLHIQPFGVYTYTTNTCI
jgi:hypothetical protein